MAEKVVHTGNYNIQVLIKYEFSSNTTNRTWSLSANLYVRVPSNFNIGPWGNFGSNTGNLVGGAIGNIATGDHKLAGPYTTSGNYNANGDAPSVTITWAWNVNSPWGGCEFPHGSTTVTGSSIGSANVTISYDGNGGTAGRTSDTVAKGSSVSLPSASRTNYSFDGWYTASSGGTYCGGSGSSYKVDSTQTVYAHWTRIQYKVTYDANGGSVGTSSATVNAGDSTTLPTPSRDGYTFNGWYTSSSGGNYVGMGGSGYTPSSNITLYAHWTPRYTVSYNANGGNSTPTSTTVDSGTTIYLASAISRSNTDSTGTVYLYYDANGGSGAPSTQSGTYTNTTPYTFNKWAVNSTSGTTYNAGAAYTVTGNVTMYATWTTGSTTRKSNPTLTVSSTVPSRTYYTFKGWNTNSSATTASYVGGNSITISSSTTLYAVWTPNPPINLSISRTSSTTTSINVSVSATGLTMTNYTLYYRVKGSGNYSSKSLGTSTTGSITGLSVDTDYEIYFTTTNAGGTSTSSTVTYSTLLNNPSITTPARKNTFPYMTTISANGSVTPSRTLTYAFSNNGGSTWTSYQSSNSYHWTDLVPETTYNMGVRVKAAHVGINASDTTATSYLNVTTPTDQVRFRVKDNGQWKKGRGYIKVNGVWKKGVRAFIKVNGQWVENKNFYDGEPSLWD